MGQLKLLYSLMLITIFSMGIVGYAIHYADDNNAAVKLNNESGFESFVADTQSEVINLKNNVNDSSKAISESDISDASGTIGRPAIFEVIGSFKNILVSISNLTKKYIGANPIINYSLTLISIFIAISIALYFWKTFKGDPE